MKRCTKCGKLRKENEYRKQGVDCKHRQRYRKDCIYCSREYDRDYYWYKKKERFNKTKCISKDELK